MALVFFLAGAGGMALLFQASRPKAPAGGSQQRPLSNATLEVLRRLPAPVEIRFYPLLDPSSVSEALRAYAGRVDGLLSEYERLGGGKVKVTRFHFKPNSPVEAAASADGIRPFNLDKGAPCYFGIAVSSGSRRESLPSLAPEWEAALEFDLGRAIARVAAPEPAPQQPIVARIDTNALAAVRKALPNLDSVSLEEGTRLLRQAALADYVQEGMRLESRVKEAEQRLADARNGQSDSELKAALQELQEAQADRFERLKDIAARSQAQVEALKQLKAPVQ